MIAEGGAHRGTEDAGNRQGEGEHDDDHKGLELAILLLVDHQVVDDAPHPEARARVRSLAWQRLGGGAAHSFLSYLPSPFESY